MSVPSFPALGSTDLAGSGYCAVKEGKKVAKVIVAEGRAEKQALDEAVRELSDLQKLQKSALKVRTPSLHCAHGGGAHAGRGQEESRTYTAYAKALKEFRKVELEFFAMRAKYERAQADLQAHEDSRNASRSYAQETTEMLQDKNREVEWLRAQKAADDVSVCVFVNSNMCSDAEVPSANVRRRSVS